jgi:hypothetical protein
MIKAIESIQRRTTRPKTGSFFFIPLINVKMTNQRNSLFKLFSLAAGLRFDGTFSSHRFPLVRCSAHHERSVLRSHQHLLFDRFKPFAYRYSGFNILSRSRINPKAG